MPYRDAKARFDGTNKKRQLIQALKDKPCADCGQKYPPYVMDFDHRDPAQKKFLVSKVQHHGLQAIIAEAAKCDVVCANCHRERSHQRKLKKKISQTC